MRTTSNLMQAHSLTFFASESCSRGTSRSALTMDESRYLLGCPADRLQIMPMSGRLVFTSRLITADKPNEAAGLQEKD